MRLAEERRRGLHHGRAHLIEIVEFGLRFLVASRHALHRRDEAVEIAVAARQGHRRGLAHMPDAEGVDEPLEPDTAPGLDAGNQIAQRHLPIAVPLAQHVELRLVLGQPEDVRGLGDQAFVEEELQLLLAQPFDVEGAAADEVLQVLQPLEGAGEFAGAAAHHGLHARRRWSRG